MSGSVFLSGTWSIGDIGGAVDSRRNRGQNARRTSGAVSQRKAGRAAALAGDHGLRSVFTTALALAGIRTRFQQVDYRNFRELLSGASEGYVHKWGRDTCLYDRHNRLIAIMRAARFDIGGRCVPVSYFVRRAA
jgi:hypothetical protein